MPFWGLDGTDVSTPALDQSPPPATSAHVQHKALTKLEHARGRERACAGVRGERRVVAACGGNGGPRTVPLGTRQRARDCPLAVHAAFPCAHLSFWASGRAMGARVEPGPSCNCLCWLVDAIVLLKGWLLKGLQAGFSTYACSASSISFLLLAWSARVIGTGASTAQSHSH